MGTNENPNKETLDAWHKDPDNWKWGVFYYNKKDKRIFPPKRIREFGWTVNFAYPPSFLILILILILVTLVLCFSK